MLTLYKLALGPILLAQAHRLRRTALRLPEAAGPRDGHIDIPAGVGGAEPIRLLVVGDSSAAGVGVARQEEALAQQAAQALAGMATRPVHWQLLAKSGINTPEALHLAQNNALAPADVIVTALGVNDIISQRRPRQFIDDYRRLLGCLKERTGAGAIVLSGLPPLHVTAGGATALALVPRPIRQATRFPLA